MSDNLPVVGIFLITNPDFAPCPSQLKKIVVFQEGERIHVPPDEKEWLWEQVVEGFQYLHS